MYFVFLFVFQLEYVAVHSHIVHSLAIRKFEKAVISHRSLFSVKVMMIVQNSGVVGYIITGFYSFLKELSNKVWCHCYWHLGATK